VTALTRAGNHVIYCNSRYRGADYALIMEKVVVDLGAAIRHARKRFGYQRIVLAGWSGGASLSVFYQQQAEHPSVTATPAGDPPDLTALDLPRADAILLMAAHPGRHQVLTDGLDASVRDESHPLDRDPELDLYNPANPNQPPYDPAFLTRYRAAQVQRNRRISGWVRRTLDELRDRGRPHDEWPFIVHGTMADPRWLDPTIDPNGREPGTSFLGDPRVVNDSPVGLARFSTLRSWLSQWSLDDARADTIAGAADISIPALVIYNEADNICTPSYATAMYEAIGHGDKLLHRIDGANHYYLGPGQEAKATEAATICTSWLAAHGMSPVSA
jgi:pimeloyl-ACP methyl ester carboxylesterase